jgi:Fe2+ transport system protein FeoA
VVSLGVGCGPIMVKSKAQPIVTTSSTEAEIQALVSGVQKVSAMYRILLEMGIHHGKPIRVLQDNISAITIAKGGEGYAGKSRHMRVRYQYLCEMSEDGIIRFAHCPTKEMIADICTKPMGGKLFKYLRSKLLNIPQTSPYERYNV